MIKLTYIDCSNALASFVRRYWLLEFDTHQQEVVRHWHATTDLHLCFFLEDKPLYLKNEQSGYYVEGNHRIGAVGLATQYNGLMKFNGRYRCFGISFMPTGLNRLLMLPSFELTDKILSAEDLLGSDANELFEQLQEAASVQQMADWTDRFFLTYYRKQKDIHLPDGLTAAAHSLISTQGLLPVKKYASIANMSLRNFERRFKEQTGTSPKFYAKLIRFENALHSKTIYPGKSWSSIAQECGYFDQAHMLKEFNQLSGVGPKELIKTLAPPNAEFIHATRPLS